MNSFLSIYKIHERIYIGFHTILWSQAADSAFIRRCIVERDIVKRSRKSTIEALYKDESTIWSTGRYEHNQCTIQIHVILYKTHISSGIDGGHPYHL